MLLLRDFSELLFKLVLHVSIMIIYDVEEQEKKGLEIVSCDAVYTCFFFFFVYLLVRGDQARSIDKSLSDTRYRK